MSSTATDGPYVIEDGGIWHVSRDHTGRERQRRRVCDEGGALAVAYDGRHGVLFKHGPSAGIEAWAAVTRRTYAHAGHAAAADDLAVVTFPSVPRALAELNACVMVTGRIGEFAERLAGMAAEAEPDMAPARP